MSRISAALFLIFAALWGLDAFLLGSQASFAALHASLPDEALMLENAAGMRIAHFTTGYGPVFWGLLKGLILLFLRDDVLALRLAFLSFKFLTIFIVARVFWLMNKKEAAILFLCLVGFMPGYYFYGKIISPEYIVLFLCALTGSSLLIDAGKLGRAYAAALVFGTLGFLTKISLLPLLAILPVYGLAQTAIKSHNERQPMGKPLIRHAAWLGLYFACLIGGILATCSGEEIKENLTSLMRIVPDTQWTHERFLLAWTRNETTWDQIRAIGLRDGFLPFVIATALSVPCLLLQATRRNPSVLIHLSLLTAATLMLVQTITHGIAQSWYLFPSTFLACLSAADLIATTLFPAPPLKPSSVCSSVFWPPSVNTRRTLFFIPFIGLLAATNLSSITAAIAFKKQTNDQLAHHAALMPTIQTYLRQHNPTAQTGAVDILIPLDHPAIIPDTEPVLPMRLALRHATEKRWTPTDYILVNRTLPTSPLLIHIVKDSLSAYQKEKDFDDLTLYIKKTNIPIAQP